MICSKCKQDKKITEFSKKGNGWQCYCKRCNIEYQRQHYSSNKSKYIKRASQRKDQLRQRLYDFFYQAQCVDCGESDPIVLQFDHREDKINGVSRMVSDGCSWDLIKEEIKKCDVVCANCHMKRTAKQQNWYTRLDLGPME